MKDGKLEIAHSTRFERMTFRTCDFASGGQGLFEKRWFGNSVQAGKSPIRLARAEVAVWMNSKLYARQGEDNQLV
jgi:hypothetical protein